MLSNTKEEKKARRWAWTVWFITVISLAMIVTAISTAAVVDQALRGTAKLTKSQREVALMVVEFPKQVVKAIKQIASVFGGPPYTLLVKKIDVEKKYWKRIFPMKEDDGYLLLSAVDSVSKKSTVKLIRISDGKVIQHWVPDWNAILNKNNPKNKYATGIYPYNVRAFHPLLLSNGDIVFNTGISMSRLSPCDGKPLWVVNDISHHSNELDKDGNIWTPSVADDAFQNNPWLIENLRDDALMKVSPSGGVIEKLSFSKILLKNELSALLLGTQGLRFNEDPIHLNQITVAEQGGVYWQEGDLLISARHLSTVFIYRPSTDKIIWHKTGPWLNQHSVNFVSDHQIIIFDNNVFGGAPQHQPFINPEDINRVMIYDFKSNTISEPFKELLAQEKPVTMTEGRVQLLPDGGLFIEETNFGRHLRFTKDKLLWSRINDYDSTHIGMVTWSRYLTQDEVATPLKNIRSRKCTPNP